MSTMLAYFNPYSDQNFLGFFGIFLNRLWMLVTGSFHFSEMASDEIQIIVLMGIAISGALVGTFLYLRRLLMLANGLSHTILLGIVVVYLLMMGFKKFGDPTEALNLFALILASLLTGFATSFITQWLTNTLKLQEDASIGIVFTSLFAAGILLVTLFTRNAHVGTELVMGNVDAMRVQDCKSTYFVVVANALFFFLFFKEFKISSFDPNLSSSLGISPLFFNHLLMILTSLTAISAFRAVGVLMVLAFFVIPPLAARRLTERLSYLLFLSMLIGILASITGVALSRHFLTVYGLALSTGGVVVCTLLVFYVFVLLFAPKRGFLVRWAMDKVNSEWKEIKAKEEHSAIDF